MLKIRLARHGAKKRPFYHIVIAEVTAPRDGRFVEKIGFYNPMVPKDNPNRLLIKKERAEYWLSMGAQPTDRVIRFLESLSIGNIKRTIPKQTTKAEQSEKTKQLIADKAEKRKSAEEKPAETAAPAAEETPVAEAPAEAPAEVPAEAPAAPVEAPAEASTEAPAEAPAEK